MKVALFYFRLLALHLILSALPVDEIVGQQPIYNVQVNANGTSSVPYKVDYLRGAHTNYTGFAIFDQDMVGDFQNDRAALGTADALARVHMAWSSFTSGFANPAFAAKEQDMKDNIQALLEMGSIPLIGCFGFPCEFYASNSGSGADCHDYAPDVLTDGSAFVAAVEYVVENVYLPAFQQAVMPDGSSYAGPHIYYLLNEPTFGEFWDDSVDSSVYETVLDWLVQGIRTKDPDAVFAGPESISVGAQFPDGRYVVDTFVGWFDMQINQNNNFGGTTLVPYDLRYVTIHNYNGDPQEFSGIDNVRAGFAYSLRDSLTLGKAIDGSDLFNTFGATTIMYSEWNTAVVDERVNTMQAGAHLARKGALMGAEGNSVDAQTHFKFIDSIENTGIRIPTAFPGMTDNGTLTQFGLRKSAYHAQWMLSQLQHGRSDCMICPSEFMEGRALISTIQDEILEPNYGAVSILIASGGDVDSPDPQVHRMNLYLDNTIHPQYDYTGYVIQSTTGARYGDPYSVRGLIQIDMNDIWADFMHVEIRAELSIIAPNFADLVVDGNGVDVPGLKTDPVNTVAWCYTQSTNLGDAVVGLLRDAAFQDDLRAEMRALMYCGSSRVSSGGPGSTIGWNNDERCAIKIFDQKKVCQDPYTGKVHLPDITVPGEGVILLIFIPS